MHNLILAFLTLTLALPVFATDGVLEINQTCAVNTGCFAGDTALYPVTITAAGSYRLTSNLVVPDVNTDAIQLDVSSVSIDLNGFEITRLGCEGATTDCTPFPAGQGIGVRDIGVPILAPHIGISVKDGSVAGLGSTGVQLGDQSEVRNLRVRWNGNSGIVVGDGSAVSGNTVYQNGSSGIGTGTDCLVQWNNVRLNTVRGLTLGPATAYYGNVINDNLGTVSGGVNMGANSCNGTMSCP